MANVVMVVSIVSIVFLMVLRLGAFSRLRKITIKTRVIAASHTPNAPAM